MNDEKSTPKPTPTFDREGYATAREVAEYLGFSTATIYRLAEKGDIPHARLAENSIRFSRRAIVQFAKARDNGAQATGTT